MLFTVTAEPAPLEEPPRMRLDLDTEDLMSTFTSIVVRRDGVPIRAVAPLGSSVSVVYDYDAPYDQACVYTVDAEVLTVTPGFIETWSNLSSWTATVAGWSASPGTATSSTDGATITRTAAGTIGSLDSLDVDWTTVRILDASDVVIATASVVGNQVVLTGSGSPVVAAGSGAFSMMFSGGTVTLAGASYTAISTTYSGVPTKVQLVAALGDPAQSLSFPSAWDTGLPFTTDLNFAAFDVAIDSAGDIWAVDFYGHRIHKFNSAGVYQLSFGSYGTGNGQFNAPRNIAFDASDNMWITDGGNNRVQKFVPSGGTYVYSSKFGTAGSGDGQFNLPLGICVDSAGFIWVTEFNGHRVQKFNSAGVFQLKFGSFGTADGAFRYPTGITSDSSNNVYVAEYGADDLSGGHRVQKFNSSGVWQTKWGTKGIGEGQFRFPVGIRADASDKIYVADTNFNDRIQKFSNTGTFLYSFDGTVSGGTRFANPYAVTTDSAGAVYVTDVSAFTIRKFGASQQAAVVDDVTVTLTPPSPTPVFGSDTETLVGAAAWLIHPTTPNLSVKIDTGPDGVEGDVYITEQTSQSLTSPASGRNVLEIEGSDLPVVVTSGPRRIPDRTLQLFTADFDARDLVLAPLKSNDPVLLRSPSSWDLDLPEGWFSVGDVTIERRDLPTLDRGQESTITLLLTPVRTPVIEASFGRTYADDVIAGGTYGDAVNSGRTYLQRLTG